MKYERYILHKIDGARRALQAAKHAGSDPEFPWSRLDYISTAIYKLDCALREIEEEEREAGMEREP